MSPEEWDAAQSSAQPAAQTKSLSPEEWEKTQPQEDRGGQIFQKALGYSQFLGTELRPIVGEPKQKSLEELKRAFTIKPSEAGQVSAGEYIKNILGSGLMGAAVTGRSIPGAVMGFGVGAGSGLAQSLAKEAGAGESLQALAGMAVPFPQSGQAAQQLERLGEAGLKALSNVPFGWRVGEGIREAAKWMSKGRPVDVSALEKTTGISAVPRGQEMKVGTNQFETQAKDQISRAYNVPPGTNKPVDYMYQRAKSDYDIATLSRKFTDSPQFAKATTNPTTGRPDPALADKYRSMFESKGAPLSGSDAIEIMKKLPEQVRDWREVNRIYSAFNDWMRQYSGSNRQSFFEAESAAKKMFSAQAIDALPSRLQTIKNKWSDSGSAIKDLVDDIQKGNYARDFKTRSVFTSELLGALRDMPWQNAQSLWGKLSPAMEKMIPNVTTRTQIAEIMNRAKSSKEVDAATRLIARAMVSMQSPQQGQ